MYDLVVQAIEALLLERISQASVSMRSRQMDPKSVGVAESAILNNEQARAWYIGPAYLSQKRGVSQPEREKEKLLTKVGLQIKQNYDCARARRRYMWMGKAELVDRLTATEQVYAGQEERRFQLNDELLIWKLRAQAA